MSSWTDRYWPFYVLAAVLAFAVPEAVALLDSNPATDPLTEWSLAKGLGEALAVLGAFLVIHFGVRLVRRGRADR